MTQLYDRVDSAGDPWDDDRRSAEAPDDAPLFDELRVAYLRGDDTHEWVRDGGTGGWAAVEEDWADWADWSAQDPSGSAAAPPWSSADPSAGGWVATEVRHEAHHEIHEVRQERGFAAEDDFVDRWTQEATGGWAPEDDPDGWDADEFEEADEEPAMVAARRHHQPARGSRAGHGRVALRRTATLLNASTVMVTGVWLLVGVGFGLLVLGGRLLTTRQLFFMVHSGLGIAMVHAFGGGIGTLITGGDSPMKDRIRKLSTAALAVVAWLASAVGTWGGYAGYRAKMPPGGNISMYPREYLMNSPGLAFWETFAMEWKVHVGWTTPFLATAVAFVALRYRHRLVADPLVRKVMTMMLLIAFAGALVAAVMGAMVNVTAPNDFMHRGWSP
jgi:hypothetical protein